MRQPKPRVRRAAWLLAMLALAGAAAGCAEPPQKELDQAQAAIEVAISAGAERLAPDTLTAARTSLTQARDAVSQRDYRSALNHALDSRERALAAAREARDAQARARTDTERDIQDVDALLARARAALDGPAPSVPRVKVRRARATEARLTAALQKARASVDAQDYGTARAALTALRADAEALLTEIGEKPPAQSPRRGR